MNFFSFFRRKPEATYKVVTFRGAANGWQTRVDGCDRTAAARLLVLLNRIENTHLHHVVLN